MSTYKIYIALFIMLSVIQPLTAGDGSTVRIGHDAVVKQSERVDDVVAVGGDVDVYGTVDGDAVAVGGSIRLGPDATIQGDAVAVGGKISLEPGASIHGDRVEIDPFNMSTYGHWLPGLHFGHKFWGFRLISFIGFLALALIIAGLMTRQVNQVTETIAKDPGTVILYGLVALIISFPLMIFMAISIVGIPLIPLEILVVLGAFVFGYIALSGLIGQKVFTGLKFAPQSVPIQVLTGLVLLALVGMIPFLGWTVKMFVGFFGFSGVVAIFVNKRRKGRQVQPVMEDGKQ